MTAVPTALAIKRLQDDSATLRLLRADTVAIAAAILGARFGSIAAGTRIPSNELYEHVEADLEALRDHFELAKSAKAYCEDWRTAGFLIRRPSVDARGETFELSPDALTALRMIETLTTPRSTVTESRLVSLAAAIRQLAIDTDPDVTRRLEALTAERNRIDAEIDRVRAGEVTVIDGRRALERVTDVLLLAQDLPADFARVRTRFEQLNHELRSSILDVDDAQSTVLDDVFRGVDLIESSDEGRTFSAFSALIRDPEQSAALDADLMAVLGREFAGTLDADTRRTLRTLVRDLKQGNRAVHGVLTEFARGLRRYVFSQEFHRDRALKDALQTALAAAAPASREVRPIHDVEVEIELASLSISSVGELSPHDPAEFEVGDALPDDKPTLTDFAELARIARESEIDFVELIGNVNAVVDEGGDTTVVGVLRAHPATQGLASVIGLLALAAQQGEVDGAQVDELAWTGTDGVPRRARVARHRFTGRVNG